MDSTAQGARAGCLIDSTAEGRVSAIDSLVASMMTPVTPAGH